MKNLTTMIVLAMAIAAIVVATVMLLRSQQVRPPATLPAVRVGGR